MHIFKPEMTLAPTKHILVILPADALSSDACYGRGIWEHLLVEFYIVLLTNGSLFL
jgi:hypothetical protein